MNRAFYKKVSAVIIGGLLTLSLAVLLIKVGIVLINPEIENRTIFIVVNLISFLLLWLLISASIYKFSLLKIIGLVGILFAAALADYYLDVDHNPITVPMIILFWLGVAYLVLPEFFKKYKVSILTMYGLIISYYLLDFILTPDYAIADRSEFARFMLTPLPVLAILWAYEQWRWLTNLQADKAKAELMLLKSQINPHFFFNTLNNLYGLVVEKSAHAPEVVLKLSDMMRYTIYEGKEDLVALKDEINYLENYIELHKIRYHKQVEIRFSKQVEEDYSIAPLLFIILLENAFKHGVERIMEGAYIQLSLIAANDRITFFIENNYEAVDPKKPVGIGLENLRKRLAHTYPKRHSLSIEKNAHIYKAQLIIDLS